MILKHIKLDTKQQKESEMIMKSQTKTGHKSLALSTGWY